MSYKKVRTVFIDDKKKVIYMKPKGTREYVKSKGEMVLLTSYLKKVEKVAAKKAMASKLAKKSPKVKSSTKYVRKGGFFFATEKDEEKEQGGGVSINMPNNVGIGGTGNVPELPPQMPQQMQQQMQQQMPPPSIEKMSQMPLMPPPTQQQTGGYYNEVNARNIINQAQEVVGNFIGELNKAADLTKGGKKAKKGKKVVKKETNPIKNFMNTLSLKKKQRKGKKMGGNTDDYLDETY